MLAGPYVIILIDSDERWLECSCDNWEDVKVRIPHFEFVLVGHAPCNELRRQLGFSSYP